MRYTTFFPLIGMTASAAALNRTAACSIATVQGVVNGLGLNGTNATVEFAYRIESNATLEAFKALVDEEHFQTDIPPVCAIRINGSTTAGSKFGFAALLPDAWNERIIAATPDSGIEWPVMSASLRYGVAAIASNSGHDVSDMNPEWVTGEAALIDWGYRALHESTVLGKALVKAWYGSTSRYNYLTGCSTGGRQALKNVQIYPDDYDGVIAGAPAWWTTHQQLWNLKYTTYNAPQNSSHSIPDSMFTVISDEVLKQCDPQDGLVDLVLSDPVGCNFDPLPLLCNKNKTADCLTPQQLPTLYKIYNGWVDVNQTFIYSHLFYGSEYSWADQIGDGDLETIESEYWYITNLLGETSFTYQDLDYSTVLLAEALNPGNATADNYDLSPFYENGGKFIHWHGLSDGAVSPGASVYYHSHVKEVMLSKGIEIDDFFRTFFIPGLEHCFGTPSNQDAPWYLAGPYQASMYDFVPENVADSTAYDSMLSLMAWVENGTAPDYMVTSNFFNNSNPAALKHNRRICPYPQQAKYIGTGNSSHEDSWNCENLY